MNAQAIKIVAVVEAARKLAKLIKERKYADHVSAQPLIDAVDALDAE